LSYLVNEIANKNAKTKSGKTVLQAQDLKKLVKNHRNRGKKVINYLKSSKFHSDLKKESPKVPALQKAITTKKEAVMQKIFSIPKKRRS
jgi:hypothetical protein